MILFCHIFAPRERNSSLQIIYFFNVSIGVLRIAFSLTLKFRLTLFISIMYEGVLPPNTPKYEFRGIQDCLQILDRQCEQYEGYMGILNPFLIFIIDDRSFLDCFENGEERLLRKSWKLYEPSTNHLFIEMPTSTIHEAAKGAFEAVFERWAGDDSNHPLVVTGGANFRGSSNRSKCPDSGWRPGYSAGGRATDWPTIAVEVVWSERRVQVEEDVKFWLTESNDQVNVAVTVTVYSRGRISIEEWRSRGPNRVPVPRQRIEIVRHPAPNCSRVSGSFRVPYEKIHARQKPRKGSDFVLGPQEMEYIAFRVWDTQFKGHP